MGSSRDEFIKYPRTPHVFGSKGTDDDKHLGEADSKRFLADPSLIVEEKIDGTSATNLLRPTRQRWVDLCADYGARIEMVYVEPPLPMIFAQNRRRERSVPEIVIRNLADKYEPPTWAEAHDLVFYQPETR